MNKEQQDYFKNARDRFTTELDSFLIAYDNATRVDKPTEESELLRAKEFLKSKKIWLGTKVADMNAPENYFELENLLEDYSNTKNAELQKEVERLKESIEHYSNLAAGYAELVHELTTK
jgi:hypothetical protein